MVGHNGSLDSLEIFSTCPQSKDHDRKSYLSRVIETARWSEEAGCTGILIYTDNGLVDPWLVAQIVIQNTERLSPLVAVQPIYMHPYTAAKMVSSLAHLYGRRMYLNMIAGGFRADLQALDDPTPHDERYARMTEYTLVMQSLLSSPEAVTFEGRYYRVRNLRLVPSLPEGLLPGILMSGTSAASLAAAQATGATAIVYPEPVDKLQDAPTSIRCGARIGIIARPSTQEAWAIANARFPDDSKGALKHKLAMAVSDSTWHKQLSENSANASSPYWLKPFQTYKTFCPYIVGSFDETADYLQEYFSKGYQTYILDIPHSLDDLSLARSILLQAASAEPRSAALG